MPDLREVKNTLRGMERWIEEYDNGLGTFPESGNEAEELLDRLYGALLDLGTRLRIENAGAISQEREA